LSALSTNDKSVDRNKLIPKWCDR